MKEQHMYVQYAFNYPESAIDFADGFGSMINRTSPHKGLDIAPNGGGAVLAVADGVLAYDAYSPVLGHVAVLAHADGKFSGYCHMAAESPLTIGTTVTRGQAIGTIGSTGSAAFGRHLHLTIATSLAGAAGGFNVIDPVAWIRGHANPEAGTAVAAASGLRTSTEEDGEPGPIYWRKVQSETTVRGWYGGGVDGIPGPNTHHAHARLQAAILNEWAASHGAGRTSTEEDGVAGPIFWTLAQRAGAAYGYAGGVDGIPGPNTERALFKLTAAWLNRYGR